MAVKPDLVWVSLPLFYLRTMRLSIVFLCLFYSILANSQELVQYFDSSNAPISEAPITALQVSPDGAIWVGTDYGLYELNQEVWASYLSNNSELADDYIKALLWQDGLWIGTLAGGLQKFQEDTWQSYNPQNSDLPSYFVSCLASTDDAIWVGTTSGAARLKNGSWFVLDQLGEGWQLNTIKSVAAEKPHKLWFGTLNSGLVRWENGAFTMFQNVNSSLPDNSIVSISIDTANNKWLATPSAGLVKYDEASFYQLDETNSGISSISSSQVLVDHLGRKIYATIDQGIFIYQEGQSLQIDMETAGLPSQSISAIAMHDSILWAGSTDGILMQISLSSSLLSNRVPEPKPRIQFWPNPAKDYLRFTLPDTAENCKLYDSSGNLLERYALPADELQQISTAHLAGGVYYLQIGSHCFRFLK